MTAVFSVASPEAREIVALLCMTAMYWQSSVYEAGDISAVDTRSCKVFNKLLAVSTSQIAKRLVVVVTCSALRDRAT